MCCAVSEVCARTFYTIWLSRAIPHLDAGRDLLSVPIIPFTAGPDSSAAAPVVVVVSRSHDLVVGTDKVFRLL